jgi:hypothetical protein
MAGSAATVTGGLRRGVAGGRSHRGRGARFRDLGMVTRLCRRAGWGAHRAVADRPARSRATSAELTDRAIAALCHGRALSRPRSVTAAHRQSGAAQHYLRSFHLGQTWICGITLLPLTRVVTLRRQVVSLRLVQFQLYTRKHCLLASIVRRIQVAQRRVLSRRLFRYVANRDAAWHWCGRLGSPSFI